MVPDPGCGHSVRDEVPTVRTGHRRVPGPCHDLRPSRPRRGGAPMTKVAAGITTSLDGYIAGPNDGPGRGLGDNGEQLHYWVFGEPWTYDKEPSGEPTGPDKEFLDGLMTGVGAVIAGRNTYEAAEAWGGGNPWG